MLRLSVLAHLKPFLHLQVLFLVNLNVPRGVLNVRMPKHHLRRFDVIAVIVVLFLVVHSLSEVLMSKGFGKRLRVCHDGGLDSNIMDRCDFNDRLLMFVKGLYGS